jgi:hypothetical protein
MAAFNTIIARDGSVEEMKLRFSESTWDRPVAISEAAARELATEKFESDARRSDWEVAPDSIEVFEIDGKDGVIGWDIEADGWQMTRD